MITLSIISFTENGKRLSGTIAEKLEKKRLEEESPEKKMEVRLYTKCGACAGGDAGPSVDSRILFVPVSVSDWAWERMQEKSALLFIGACGIAVRAIAPSLTDKLHDVPVLVMDEKGAYVIPILAGHMGGANELAAYLAEKTGAEPVITTATDIDHKFAVDLFAKRNCLFIANKDGIVKVSSKTLAGKEITISAEPMEEAVRAASYDGMETDSGVAQDCLPEGVRLVPYPPAGFVDVVVTSEERVFDASVILKPKEYVIGMGCKKGKEAEEIEAFITKKTGELGIAATQIYALASIFQKRGEPGLLAWCRKEGVPFLTYTAKELQEIEGDFTASDFVREQMDVDNVCERAALKACGEGGELLIAKCAENGMTIAVARRKPMGLRYSCQDYRPNRKGDLRHDE